MVRIDTVYQKVLILANKEQRGYITPQEFNLLADKAQLEIFENYFHDLKTAYHKRKNENVYSDEVEMIYEKLQFLKQEDGSSTFTVEANTSTINLSVLNPRIYKLDTVFVHSEVTDIESDDFGAISDRREFTELSKKELIQSLRNPLTSPTSNRPVFVREGSNILRVYPAFAADEAVTFYYWRKPVPPNWSYVVVSGEALYNANTSIDFELHPSEEEALVTRILALAGLTIKNMEMTQAVTMDEANTNKKQND